ncbi:hypothetical protein [Crocosphaera sp.]|uniref:hypothetical protein n=1 Tax=Crocosphaera sp. TaxID=2729996 RepID=UPI00260A4757|nr:hypothetical protein [Crocosphaera sp.]MDJ0579523.1 hypothetical protein [Crocosphaera sp.]
MNNKTFEVEIKDGILVIPPEIQDYVRQCQGNTKVSITIISSSDNSDDITEKERQKAKAILQRSKKHAQSNISKSVDELWSDFNKVKGIISLS